MTTIFIDQKSYECDPNSNLLEAALLEGLNLPYFCWHPALGSVGSCRQCAVQQFADENDTQGRTVMACMTPLKEGARFSIDHPTCTNFRKHVIEWMMINHPHDCPVCDEGGECHLQDMTVMTGHNSRHYRFKKRTFQNQNLGPYINHEMNRCITCYRCVRYYRDIAGGTDLSPFANSGRVYFGRNEDGRLESGFSGNLVEVCPTGVFTDKLFHRHHIRKWDLQTAPSICQRCSVGCNISPGARYGQLRRIQNRYNHDVNGYFICDRGRFGHEFINSPRRLKTALLQGKASDVGEANEKIKAILETTHNIIGIGSAKASLESNWALRQLVGAENFYDGENSSVSLSVNEALAQLKHYPQQIASLRDIRESDAIIIIGEDITHSAPMMALSVRQAAISAAEEKAWVEQKIPSWNDGAVRNHVRNSTFPLLSAHITTTGLDDIAQDTCALPLEKLHELLLELKLFLENKSSNSKLDSWIEQAGQALLKAKRPVIICGTSLHNPVLIKNVAQLLEPLSQEAKLSIVAPQVNSIGLALLSAQPLSKLKAPVDVVIILENDLYSHFDESSLAAITSAKHMIVIDYEHNATVEKADIALPCLSFAQSTGSVISQEGRLQRYFSVFSTDDQHIQSPWRMLLPFLDKKYQWENNDMLCSALAHELHWPEDIFNKLFKADFKVMGHGIARQTSEYSGRTAMNADKSMHEPKPLTDLDSPLVYSMEGARRKIPLPLISSSWEPRWNSVQASFRDTLMARKNPGDEISGLKIFKHIDAKNREEGAL
ncbi:MAG: NADH-quinone oxidoreductase subunit NuoG [Myxococcales bacterium]|nr:NADH-quinone oxidoreductase subunit NuoG [Myxococcales bacterium]USN50865.1 MAG: NADH-quinone oxidoreductase subunit NuoG [Myxococcales bacterium]